MEKTLVNLNRIKTEETYSAWQKNALEDDDVARELQTMQSDLEQIADAFYRDLAFGTGGLRGVIGAGTNRMNIYTVAKASQGLADYVKEKGFAPEDMVVISPDLGGVSRARNIASRLECGLAIIDKRRPEPGVAEVINLIGNVEGKICVMVDDIVDTAGSLCEGAKALKKFGAKDIYACVTHPILTDPALSRIAQSEIKELIVTNTIPLPPNKKHPKITQLSVAPILAETILRIYNQLSISQLFEI